MVKKPRVEPMKDLENRLLFGDPKNKRALISLINGTLGLDVEDAVVMNGKTIRSKEKMEKQALETDDQQTKKTILSHTEVDVLATLPDNTKVIVEFQLSYQKHYGKRMLLYSVSKYLQQLELLVQNQLNPTISDVYPVYIVSILDHVFFQEHDKLVSIFRILEETRLQPLLDENGKEMLKFMMIELPKFKENDQTVSQLLKDWCKHFRNEDLTEDVDADVLFARSVIEEYSKDKEVQAMIESKRLNEIFIYAEGRDKGLEVGMREGRLEGRLEGSDEEKQRIAQAMLADQLPLVTISRYTGLTREALKKLESAVMD